MTVMTAFAKWPVTAAIAPLVVTTAMAVTPTAAAAPAPTPTVTMEVAPMASVTTGTVQGTRFFGLEGEMDEKLDGTLCEGLYMCVEVPYSASIFTSVKEGVRSFQTFITSTDGKRVGFAYSQGAMVVHEWMDGRANDPSAPSTEDLAFVLIGNPYRVYGGSQADKGEELEITYDTIDISAMYDSVSDDVIDPWNFVAKINLSLTAHIEEYDEDVLKRPDLLVREERNPNGTTTLYVLVPPEDGLPMLKLMRAFLPKTAARWQEILEPIVEKGHYREGFVPAGPDGVALPFADEDSTAVEVTNDGPTQVPSSARMSLQAHASEPEQPAADDDEQQTVQVSEAVVEEPSQEDQSMIESAPAVEDEVQSDVEPVVSPVEEVELVEQEVVSPSSNNETEESESVFEEESELVVEDEEESEEPEGTEQDSSEDDDPSLSLTSEDDEEADTESSAASRDDDDASSDSSSKDDDDDTTSDRKDDNDSSDSNDPSDSSDSDD